MFLFLKSSGCNKNIELSGYQFPVIREANLLISNPEVSTTAVTTNLPPAIKMMLKMGWLPGLSLVRFHQGIQQPVGVNNCQLSPIGNLLTTRMNDHFTDDKTVTFNMRSLQHINSDKEILHTGTTVQTLPEIKIRIPTGEIIGLIDTGSEVTCLAEETYMDLRDGSFSFPILPVTGVQIRGATGQRSLKVTKQI